MRPSVITWPGAGPEIRIEEGRGPAKVFIPQHHPPGMEAEVDFGELWVRLAGVLVKCYLFAFRMSYSGKAVHLVSATCGQEAFLEGHVHAFTVLGGVPAGQIRYDNLTPAVTRVLRKGRARIENPRWTAFRSHYRFAAFYCEPGIEGAHEKGGVEGQVGYFRRNHLVPVPEVDSLAELNARVAVAEEAEDARRVGSRIRAIGQDFAAEAPRLVPLPDEPFETGLLLTPRVDRYSQVTVRMNRYSVPVRLIGRQVRVVLRSSELVIYDGRREAARHERAAGQGRRDARPGPLPGGADAQARSPGRVGPAGPGPRIRGVHRRPRGAVGGGPPRVRRARRDPRPDRGPAAAPAHGRRRRHHRDRGGAVGRHARRRRRRGRGPPGRRRPHRRARPGQRRRRAPAPQVASLTLRRLAALPADSRPLPTVSAYDQLLTRPLTPKEGLS